MTMRIVMRRMKILFGFCGPFQILHHCGKAGVYSSSILWAKEPQCMTTQLFRLLRELSKDDSGQDIAEYAVMLAVILVLVVGTVRLIGSNANTVFSNAASSLQ